jgi:hypothetical protein
MSAALWLSMSSTRTASRRAFLRGTGALAIGLPLRELTHGRAFAQGVAAEKRFIVVFSHGGEIMSRDRWGSRADGTHHRIDDWRPLTTQENLSPSMLGATHRGIFDGHLAQLLILRGLTNLACAKVAPHAGGHKVSNVTALTAADATGGDAPEALAPSIDMVIASRQSAPTPLRVGVQGHNYGSPFFQGSQQRAGASTDVRAVFNSLFGDATTTTPSPEVQRARLLRRSVLDGVLDGARALRGRVSTADRDIHHAHLDGLRALEQRVDSYDNAVCAAPTSPRSAHRIHETAKTSLGRSWPTSSSPPSPVAVIAWPRSRSATSSPAGSVRPSRRPSASDTPCTMAPVTSARAAPTSTASIFGARRCSPTGAGA